jgi:hypothetical protein
MKNEKNKISTDANSEAFHELSLGHSYVHSKTDGLLNVAEFSLVFILGHRIIDCIVDLLRNTFYYSFNHVNQNELSWNDNNE